MLAPMSTVTFDTQELVQELHAAGMPPEQAEGVVRTIVKSHTDLATKQDIEPMRTELKAEWVLNRWMLATALAIALANFAKQFS